MKNVFIVWFDNQEEYIENREVNHLKVFSTRKKAESFIKQVCSQEYKPSMTLEQFKQIEDSFLYVEKYYREFCEREKKKFMSDKDINKYFIEEVEVN